MCVDPLIEWRLPVSSSDGGIFNSSVPLAAAPGIAVHRDKATKRATEYELRETVT